MKNFDEYRNFYVSDEGAEGGGGLTPGFPIGMPEPKTFKEFAVAKLCGLAFGPPPESLEPKTPIEKYLEYAIENADAGIPGIPGETTLDSE